MVVYGIGRVWWMINAGVNPDSGVKQNSHYTLAAQKVVKQYT